MRIFSLVLICCVGLAIASPTTILFSDFTVDTTSTPEFNEMEGYVAPNTDSAAEVKELFLVQFSDPMETSSVDQARVRLQERGATLFGYVPHNTLYLYGTHEDAAFAQALKEFGVIWVGFSSGAHKRTRSLRSLSKFEGPLNGFLAMEESTPTEEDAPVYLRILLAPVFKTAGQLTPVVQMWRKGLLKALGLDDPSQVRVTAASKSVVTIYLASSEYLSGAVDFVSSRPESLSIERRFPSRVTNAYSHGVLQSGDQDHSPLWDVGLTGEGQIVGIGDSGVDFNRCAFTDEMAPTIVNSPNGPPVEDNGHRKIKAYWAMMDADDEYSGHGTHVSGTVGGNVKPGSPGHALLHRHNGGAFDARIVFTDIGCTAEAGCPCLNDQYCTERCPLNNKGVRICPKTTMDTYEPDDLNANFFPFSYDNGARIHTNSWGEGDDSTYKVSSMMVDTFLWEHKDFLVLFAAGNSGGNGFYTIDPEGVAKNCLTIGASQTTNDGFKESIRFTDFEPILKGMRDLLMSHDRPEEAEMFKTTKGCCSALYNSKKTCAWLEGKGKACEKCCDQHLLAEKSLKPLEFDQNNMAFFSSKGLTRDGRVKPDVVSPGQNIVSVKSQHTQANVQCGDVKEEEELTQMSGTSMATPAAAAHTTLVRQYFVDGFYPTGAKVAKNGFIPSAALLKAVMINSGVALSGIAEQTNIVRDLVDPGTIPSTSAAGRPHPIQGFGRITLDRALPLSKNNAETTLKLLIAPATPQGTRGLSGHADPSFFATGSTYEMCFLVEKNSLPVKSTLVYTDPPAQPNSAIALVNDLDLAVHRVAPMDETSNDVLPSRTYLGNGLLSFGDNGDVEYIPDRRNNVEQVDLQIPAAQYYYRATVSAHRIVQGPQPFALIVTGAVAMVDCRKVNEAAASYVKEQGRHHDHSKNAGHWYSGILDLFPYLSLFFFGVVGAGFLVGMLKDTCDSMRSKARRAAEYKPFEH